jgi:hypothetical protein
VQALDLELLAEALQHLPPRLWRRIPISLRGRLLVRNKGWTGVISANLMRTRVIDNGRSREEDIVSKEMDDRYGSSGVTAFIIF